MPKDKATDVQFGRMYHHYKGGLYMALADSIATDDIKAGDTVVNYRHLGGTLYSRPIGEWRKPVEGMTRPRFLLIPECFKLDLDLPDRIASIVDNTPLNITATEKQELKQALMGAWR